MPWLDRTAGGWRVGWREGGRASPKRWSQVFGTKQEAADELVRVRAHMATPVRSLAPMPWVEVVERYVAWRMKLGASTRYEAELRAALLTRSTRPPWETTRDASVATVEVLPVGTAKLALAVLRWARKRFRQPVDEDALGYEQPSRPRKPEAPLLTDEQVAALLARAERLCLGGFGIGHVVSVYGHRPESVVPVPTHAFDLKAARYRLRVKSGDLHEHPLTTATVALLRRVLAGRPPDAPAFLGPTGEPWADGRSFSSWWHHQVGMPCREVAPGQAGIKQVKGYAISNMLARGLDLKTIASITGHRTPGVLLRYARTNEQRQAEAIRALEAAPHGAPRGKRKRR